ncbi:MAG TPA: protein phosphatase 2C domain-containing protein [Candidatus Acidoferrales bacterium]|nr:protein phosphatase 2C domain-containing protein [Candidatus Acidoferrales bacterium]
MALYTWYQSDIGLVRSSNQDSLGCFPENGLFIVADGLGGHADGHIASRLAVDTIRDELLRNNSVDDYGQRLHDAIIAAHEKIRAAAAGRGGSAAMGTTVVVLKLSGEDLCANWAHVGDSRLYRMRQGRLVLLTADHTAFGEPYRDGGDVPLDLPHTNQLLEALGAGPRPAVSTGKDRVKEGDLFLLCSDGLSSTVRPADLRDELSESQALDAVGSALVERAHAAGAPDNISSVLVRVAK